MSGGRDDDATADDVVPEPDDVSDVHPDATLDSNWVVVDAPLPAARDDADEPEPDEPDTDDGDEPEPDETDEPDTDDADEPDDTDDADEPEPDTDEPEPDDTDEPEPDDTDEPEPDDTDEPEPDDTDEPEPDDTDEPDSDDTDEPEPDDTDEPEPDEPEPDDTDEPEPDEPEPDDADEPEPDDTDEPDSDDTDEPEPDETDEPEPDEPEPDDADEPEPVDANELEPDDVDEVDEPEPDESDDAVDHAEPVVPVLPSNRSAQRGPSEPGVEIQMTRWDRPPPPHDWRYYVNRTGRTLITLGLLMFGFVAYQLWGTGIQTARAQNRLEAQFEEALAAAATDAPTTVPTTVAVTTTPSPGATSVPVTPTTAPSTVASPSTAPTTTPPSTAPPTTVPIAPGRALARLEIPKIDKSLYVLPGVDVETLHDGPGHYPDTPLPGQLGNSAIAGHRTTSGAPFGDIDELEPGDELIVTMTNGDRFVYQVTESFIVSPSEYWVVRTDDPTVAMLTLTSCHPEYTARQRIIVRSVLKPAESAPAGEPTFYELEDDPDENPPPTTFVDGVPIPVTVPGGSTPDDPTVTDTGTAADDTGGDTAGDGSAIDEPGPDGLTAGWFEDTAAWPHVFGWGAACVLLALSASWLSRRFRSYLIGVALVTLPFVVTLFFFYENVNRLLPAGL